MKGNDMTLRMKVKERFGKKFDDEIRFFKGWVSNTKAVGAIMLDVAKGDAIAMARTLEQFPLELRSVRDYAAGVLAASA